MKKPVSDEIHVIFRKQPVYRPHKNWVREMGFGTTPPTEDLSSRVRKMSDEKLSAQESIGGITGVTAGFERERRSWRGKLRHALSIVFLWAFGLFLMGMVVWNLLHTT